MVFKERNSPTNDADKGTSEDNNYDGPPIDSLVNSDIEWDYVKDKNGKVTGSYFYPRGYPNRVLTWEEREKINLNTQTKEKRIEDRTEMVEDITKAFTNLYGKNIINSKTISTLQNFVFSKIKEQQKEDIDNLYIDTPFFLPFNVSLDMDGLSGMTLYQIFRITKTIFPSDYETKKINLVVNSLNHNITPKSWITQLSAYPHPEPELKNQTTEMIEKENDKLYNTCFVFKNGKLLDFYIKLNLYILVKQRLQK